MPRLEMRPRIGRPPVLYWRGIRPSQAPKSRPRSNASPLPIAATMAVEIRGPTPGMLIKRWQFASRCPSSPISRVIVSMRWLTPQRMATKREVTKAPGARHASFRFVAGELDLFRDATVGQSGSLGTNRKGKPRSPEVRQKAVRVASCGLGDRGGGAVGTGECGALLNPAMIGPAWLQGQRLMVIDCRILAMTGFHTAASDSR